MEEQFKNFPCSKKDVGAIAKRRINEQEKSSINKWTWVVVIIAAAGIIVSRLVMDLIGYGIIAVAVVILFWYTGKLGKKQKAAKVELTDEWEKM